jgi:hypothetical protein
MRRMDPQAAQTRPETAVNPLQSAIEAHGIVAVARACGLSYQAVGKWVGAGRMPRTEHSGETAYSAAIEQLTGGKVTRAMLLAMRPQPADAAAQGGGGRAAAKQAGKGDTQLAHQAG